MGHISEPKEVDFLIKCPPLTDEERKEISEFIRKRKHSKRKKSTVAKRKEKQQREAKSDGNHKD